MFFSKRISAEQLGTLLADGLAQPAEPQPEETREFWTACGVSQEILDLETRVLEVFATFHAIDVRFDDPAIAGRVESTLMNRLNSTGAGVAMPGQFQACFDRRWNRYKEAYAVYAESPKGGPFALGQAFAEHVGSSTNFMALQMGGLVWHHALMGAVKTVDALRRDYRIK